MSKVKQIEENEEIEKIHEKQRKIPKEVSQDILKKIFANILKAIGILVYFMVLNFAYTKIEQIKLIEYIKVISGVFLVGGLIELERAYKKDSGIIAITSIELLCLCVHALTIMHVITVLKYDFRVYLLTSSYIIAIYYILKSIIIYTKEKKKYLQSLSDISDIVKKDEPIKKEAKKREEKVEQKQEENKKRKDESKKKEKTKSTKKRQTAKKKTEDKQEKKSTTRKKATTSKKNTTKKEEIKSNREQEKTKKTKKR